MQGFHMQICSLIIPWQMEYVEVYSLHISVILFNCPSVPHGQSFYNKLVLETYNEDPLMVSMVADNKVLRLINTIPSSGQGHRLYKSSFLPALL